MIESLNFSSKKDRIEGGRGNKTPAMFHLRTCRPPPSQKWWPQKVVMNGAECAE